MLVIAKITPLYPNKAGSSLSLTWPASGSWKLTHDFSLLKSVVSSLCGLIYFGS